MGFLLEILEDLNVSLKEQLGLRLVIAKGKPEEVFPKLYQHYDVKHLSLEGERVEPYGRLRDQTVRRISKESGVKVSEHFTHSLFDQELLFQMNSEVVPGSYNGFLGLLSGKGLRPAKPIETIP